MSGVALAALLHTFLISSGVETYTEAHRVTTETGKPMVVMVSAEWCAPCQTMKRQVIPQLRKRGLLKRVAFAIVNPDRNGPLARKLTGGGPIPQLVMYRRTNNGWRRRKLVGGQSIAAVEKFINEGITSNEETNKTRSLTENQAPKKDTAQKTKVEPASKH